MDKSAFIEVIEARRFYGKFQSVCFVGLCEVAGSGVTDRLNEILHALWHNLQLDLIKEVIIFNERIPTEVLKDQIRKIANGTAETPTNYVPSRKVHPDR